MTQHSTIDRIIEDLNVQPEAVFGSLLQGMEIGTAGPPADIYGDRAEYILEIEREDPNDLD